MIARNRLRYLAAVAVLSVGVFGAAGAQASVIPILQSVTSESAGVWRYTYDVTLTGEVGLRPQAGAALASQLSILDFAGYVPGSLTSLDARWATTTPGSLSGLLPVAGHPDDASLANLTLTWTGAPLNVSGGPYAATHFSIYAFSTLSGLAPDGFTARAIANSGPDVGTVVYNYGQPDGVPGGVPEPATWAMMILGMGLVGASLRMRRARQLAMLAA